MALPSILGKRFRVELLATGIYSVLGALLTIILARILDPDGYGLLFLALSVCGVLRIFAKLGIGKSTGKYIATYKEKNPEQIPNILKFGLVLNCSLILLVSIMIYFFHDFIAQAVGEPDLSPFILLGALYVAFSALNYYCRRTLQGFESIKASSISKIVKSVVKFILSIILVLLGYGAIGAFMGHILGLVAASIIGISFLYFQHYQNQISVPIEPGLRKRILEYSLPITLTSTSANIDRNLDTILVGFFIGPMAVAFYTVGKQVISFIETPVSALGFSLSPSYESQRAQGNPDVAAKIYEEGMVHTLLLYIPASAGLIIISEPFVLLIFGEEYLGAVSVLQVLAVYAVFLAMVKITGSGLDFLGKAKQRSIIRAITTILNVILNLILIPTLGVVGAAIATLISYSIYSLSNVYLMHAELPINSRYLLSSISKIILITLVMAISVYSVISYANSVPTLISTICLGIIIWAVLGYIVDLIDIKKIWSTLV